MAPWPRYVFVRIWGRAWRPQLPDLIQASLVKCPPRPVSLPPEGVVSLRVDTG